MNTPWVWIIFPGLLAIILLVINRWERIVIIIATLTSGSLAGLALWLPVKELFFVGSLTIHLADTWFVLGRSFILGAAERPVLVVLYLGAAFWFGATYIARPGRLFAPLGLGIVALLTATIAVEPFLYSALLFEIVVIVSIPILLSPAKIVGRGVLRYLTFMMLGMPLILTAGWMLTGVEVAPVEPGLAFRITIVVGLGFALLLGIFPFHTWVSMLAEESHPYASAFILLLLPGAVLFLILRFLDRYIWLRDLVDVLGYIRWAGVLMVVIAGLWAAFQRHLGRMLGFAVMLEIGISLVSISLGGQAALPSGGLSGMNPTPGGGIEVTLGIFFASVFPRGLALGVWALALTIIRSYTTSLRFRDVQGIARRLPIAGASLVLAHFSLAGVPLLAGFPVRMALLEGISQVSPLAAFGVLLGMIGLLTGGLRTLAVFVMGPEETWHAIESWSQILFLVLGMIALLALGLVPQWFLPFFANLPGAFLTN